MRNHIIAAATAISLAALPGVASAQVASAAPSASTNSTQDKRGMTPEQTADYESWPEERQVEYQTWTPVYQVYYWELAPEQQEQYWFLTPDQRIALYEVDPKERETRWEEIMAYANGETRQVFVNNAVVQQVPEGRNDNYPVCRGEVQDECINPRAAGLDWGNKPLPYFPEERAGA